MRVKKDVAMQSPKVLIRPGSLDQIAVWRFRYLRDLPPSSKAHREQNKTRRLIISRFYCTVTTTIGSKKVLEII